MKYTEKLNLKKPEEEDFISVSDYTDNMEIIDQAVTDASQKADDAASAAASATTAARNAQAAAREATGSAQSAIIAAEEAKKAADANEKELGNKVTAEKGKGLSECNYTKEEKNKLAGVQTMQGTDGEENGKEGLVPAPEADDAGRFLHSSGTWSPIWLEYVTAARLMKVAWNGGSSAVIIPEANTGNAGLMPASIYDRMRTIQSIDGVDFSGTETVSHYAVCDTSGATTAKAVTITGFKLIAGARITVRFNYANTATNPTLNVNATRAKPIYYKNSNIPAELIEQYTVLELVYSGSYWYVVGNMNILTKGDSISVECFTAGYVTSMGQEVQFCIPVSTPIVGCSSVKIESATGLQIRQNGNYVYGGNASTLVAASSYRGVINRNMVSVAATMPNTTNAVNNAPCGVRAALKLTFS